MTSKEIMMWNLGRLQMIRAGLRGVTLESSDAMDLLAELWRLEDDIKTIVKRGPEV